MQVLPSPYSVMKDFFELRLVVLMDREDILWLLMSRGLAIEFENVQSSDRNVVLGLIDPNENLPSFDEDLSRVRDLEILEMLDILNVLLLEGFCFRSKPCSLRPLE